MGAGKERVRKLEDRHRRGHRRMYFLEAFRGPSSFLSLVARSPGFLYVGGTIILLV